MNCPTKASDHQVIICASYNPPAPQTTPIPSPGWRQVPAPALRQNARYYAVTATGPSDAWAVGNTGLPGQYPLIVHWNGVRWSQVTLSASMRRLDTFTSVVAANPGNVWVAGHVPDSRFTPHLYHFDGTQWHDVPLPSDVLTLSGMAITPDGHLWAAGWTSAGKYEYVIHWNGRGWTRLTTAIRIVSGTPGISARTDTDVWVVADPGEIYHWDGERLARAASPVRTRGGTLPYLVALTPDDVWAAGIFGAGSSTGTSTALGPPGLLHWDGKAWHQVSVPLARPSCGLNGIASDGAGGIWVVPCLSDWRGAQYLHWRSGRWTDVYAKPLGAALSEFAVAIALVPGTQQVWSAEPSTCTHRPDTQTP